MPINPYVGAGIARGFNQASQNLFNIMEKRKERKREDELFALQKKEAELSIKKMELGELDPETIRLEKEKLKADVTLQKAKAAEADIALEDARKTTTERLQELRNQMDVIRGYDQGQRDGLVLPGTAPTAGAERAGMGLPAGWEVELEAGEKPKIKYKTPKEKKDYLLTIPPKELETKKKGFWPRLGNAMLSTITGGYAEDITEADRTATIAESKRKYAADEELSTDEATLLIMNNIKTKQDLEELLENREQYESEGVDVELILDFFAPEEEK